MARSLLIGNALVGEQFWDQKEEEIWALLNLVSVFQFNQTALLLQCLVFLDRVVHENEE